MTVYEHVMIGANLALGTGLHQRFGWRIIGVAGCAAALPDWDGLSILFGPQAFAGAHRVWGHNLFVATTTGAAFGAAECRWGFLGRLGTRFGQRAGSLRGPVAIASARPTPAHFSIWAATGIVACWSHLFADLFYSGHADLTGWPLQLAWPLSTRGWTFPIVPGGDLGATLIFVGEMFALYRWPNRARPIAMGTLLAVIAFVVLRFAMLRR
jgi:hypothetical protein